MKQKLDNVAHGDPGAKTVRSHGVVVVNVLVVVFVVVLVVAVVVA